MTVPLFDIDCTRCHRLVRYLRQVKKQHPDYYCAPVPSFGVSHPYLLIVGLAPGKHGANRTGRPFTGDYAGILLYKSLHRYGFATRASAESVTDGMYLRACRIVNAVKCLPPNNMPTNEEIGICNQFLRAEIERLHNCAVILALGHIAHRATLKALGLKLAHYRFRHGVKHVLPMGELLLDSYHCSRYNVQTGRLTERGFHAVIQAARRMIDDSGIS